MKKVIIK